MGGPFVYYTPDKTRFRSAVPKDVIVHDILAYLETLASHVHEQGGWGYTYGQTAQLEPTCLALLALSQGDDRFGPLIEQGETFLEKCAGKDGAYRWKDDREE